MQHAEATPAKKWRQNSTCRDANTPWSSSIGDCCQTSCEGKVSAQAWQTQKMHQTLPQQERHQATKSKILTTLQMWQIATYTETLLCAFVLQGRLSIELAALGTPEVPLNRVRVPRQAATAAKAAIKKDLLEQNRRPGAAQLSTPKPTAHQLDSPVVKALPLENGNQSAAKQTVPRQKKQAKVLSAQGSAVTVKQACSSLICL